MLLFVDLLVDERKFVDSSAKRCIGVDSFQGLMKDGGYMVAGVVDNGDGACGPDARYVG